MKPRYDVIVAGVGPMGAAACLHLAFRGVRVLGLDRATIPNDQSSHHGRTRVFRSAYFEHPDYVPLLRRARLQWRDLAEQSRLPLYHETGVLTIGPADGAIVPRATAAARAHALPHESLGRSALAERFPWFRTPPGSVGLFEPEGGWLLAEESVAAIAHLAQLAGATLRPSDELLDWTSDGRTVRVRARSGDYEAARLVLTTGPWSAPLLASFGVLIRVTRQAIFWLTPRDPSPFASPGFPVWAIETPPGLAYGFPSEPGSQCVKAALHVLGEVCDPDRVDPSARAHEEQQLLGVLREYLPDAAGSVRAHGVCRYDNSPDGNFIIDTHPLHANVVFGAGFSGHGFKFAPAVGELLADLALHGRSDLPAAFLGLARFTPDRTGVP